MGPAQVAFPHQVWNQVNSYRVYILISLNAILLNLEGRIDERNYRSKSHLSDSGDIKNAYPYVR